jgi:hypothetical protein
MYFLPRGFIKKKQTNEKIHHRYKNKNSNEIVCMSLRVEMEENEDQRIQKQ